MSCIFENDTAQFQQFEEIDAIVEGCPRCKKITLQRLFFKWENKEEEVGLEYLKCDACGYRYYYTRMGTSCNPVWIDNEILEPKNVPPRRDGVIRWDLVEVKKSGLV